MKTKLIYTGIIAALFIAAMIIFKEKNTLSEIIAYFVGAGGTLAAVYNWLTKKEAVAQKKEAEQDLQRTVHLLHREQNISENLRSQVSHLKSNKLFGP